MRSLYPVGFRFIPIPARAVRPVRSSAARWLPVALLPLILLGAGCAVTRSVIISATPPDATIRIDGVVRGTGGVHEDLRFGGGRAYTVMVSRPGFNDALISLDSAPSGGRLDVNLTPRTKHVRLLVLPYPALVKIDGQPIANEEITQAATELVFAVDSKDEWIPHVATAERPGFRRAEQLIRFTDPDAPYTLVLTPEQKDVTIHSDPEGADVMVDGAAMGRTPLTLRNFVIGTDPLTHEWIGRKVHVTKPGYEPADTVISWDEGKADYRLKLAASIAATPAPPAAPTPPPTTTATTAPAARPPATVAATHPATTPAAVATTRDLPLLRVKWTHEAGNWRAKIERVATVAPLQTSEAGAKNLSRVVAAPARGIINSVATSPDGSFLTYDILWETADHAAAGQIVAHPLEPGRSQIWLTDNNSLNLMPSFAPDGNRVLFSSSAGGKGLAIYQHALDAPDAKRVSPAGPAMDLWPSLDSSPQPRLYVESPATDGGPSHLAVIDAHGTRTDLKQQGNQPRVSPTADAVLFTRADPKTGKRDLFLLKEGTEEPLNLTHSPDADDFDPAWSKDGMQIAFASDRPLPQSQGAATAPQPRRPHVWMIDLTSPDRKPRPLTSSPAWDDNPAWNDDASAIYFRSNRGGEWGIWKMDVK